MRVHGGCHCGAVAFEAEIDPASVTVCHCRDCQILSGTAFRVTAAGARRQFDLKRGELSTYVKRADSGVSRALTFCTRCGASIYSTDADDPVADLQIRTGILEERDALVPSLQIWTRSAQRWLDGIDQIPRSEPGG